MTGRVTQMGTQDKGPRTSALCQPRWEARPCVGALSQPQCLAPSSHCHCVPVLAYFFPGCCCYREMLLI